jgi:hypothetical protein
LRAFDAMRRFPFIILGLAFGAALFAQAPSPPPAPSPAPAASPSATPSPAPSPTPTPAISLNGVWAGSAKLTTEGAAPCHYVAPAAPPGVRLEIVAAGASGKGKLTLSLPAPQGSACPKLRSDAQLKELKLSESTASFRDAQGRDWNLALKEGALKGIFSGAGGSGEVELRKTAEIAGGPGLGKGVSGIVAANLVGVGALVGLNKALQDNQAAGTKATCSPRACVVVSVPGDACDCSPTLSNIVSGGSCGQTTNGIAIGGACSLPTRPCESEVSCDNGVCQNPFPLGGPCPLRP